jgi:hypothetical protein
MNGSDMFGVGTLNVRKSGRALINVRYYFGTIKSAFIYILLVSVPCINGMAPYKVKMN